MINKPLALSLLLLASASVAAIKGDLDHTVTAYSVISVSACVVLFNVVRWFFRKPAQTLDGHDLYMKDLETPRK